MKEKLMGIFFPKVCPLCERVIKSSGDVCEKCDISKFLIGRNRCYKCGKPLKGNDEILCGDCRKINHTFEKGVAVFEYKEEMKESVYRFKYGNQKAYGDFYGKIAAEKYGELLKRWKIDKIIPVPMYDKKKQKRGYNQAEEFGNRLGFYTGIETDNKSLIRIKDTIPQKGLSNEQRKMNMSDAFAVDVEKISNYKNVLLVDDIYTTGSTIDACSKILIMAGVEKVYFVCIATGMDK